MCCIFSAAAMDVIHCEESSSEFQQPAAKVRGPDLVSPASLGAEGRCPNKCHSAIVSLLQSDDAIKPVIVAAPIANLTGDPIVSADVSIFEPHRTLSVLYEHHPHVFRERVLLDEEELEQVRDCMEGHPQLKNHPVLERETWKKRAIPLCIHGDGVPLTGLGKSWSKFMDVFTVSSI